MSGFNPKDHYFKKAKEQNFAARSVFKLEEIDQRLKLIQKGQSILDLGCAPGSWSQYASKKVGDSGRVIGLDLTPVTLKLSNVTFLQADMLSVDLKEKLLSIQAPELFDGVISDMAPKTTGIKVTDQARSAELCEKALAVADQYLKPNGFFICKLFHSDDFKSMKTMIQDRYQKFEAIKPESTRSMSKEIFLIGIKKKNR